MSICIRELTHIYSEGLPYQSIALDSVSFDILDGELAGIIGHTGSGKSTLVQHLNGLLKPKSGSIVINGVDITKGDIPMRDIRRKVGLVFQYPEYQLFEENVYKDVAFGPLNLGLPVDETDKCVREAIGLVGLDFSEISERSPFELSGGQKRRVAIAGVISMKPEVLILDEPTAGLDPKQILEIRDLITELGKDHTVILSSHILPEVSAVCKRVLIINRGAIIADDTPENLAQRLLGGSHILLRVDGTEEKISQALGKISSIKKLEFKESQETGTTELIAEASNDEDIRRDIFKSLASANLSILMMRSQDMSLEEIFLNLTTEEAKA